ncbi:MAG TPA: ABC transporter permease [Gemmatimonadaceae bacterium]|nr:ABC transporter permease [Gemmatimonadaceae bacterium]
MIEYALLGDALVRATPLILTGLAVALAFRAGVFNIGAEGQLLAGAAASAAIGVKLGGTAGVFSVPLLLVIGAGAGALWAMIAAELRRRFNVLEIISTIMLNFVAIHTVSFLVRGPLQEPTRIYPQTESISQSLQLPIFVPGTRLHVGFIIAIIVACALSLMFRYTATGFRIRAIGANRRAAAVAGRIDVERTSYRVFLLSGAMAGLAGAVEVSGVTFALYENISPGYGYTAIAVALIAGLHPLGVIASGVFFGLLETGATALQRDFGIPSSTASVAEAILILIALAVTQIKGRGFLPLARKGVA